MDKTINIKIRYKGIFEILILSDIKFTYR